MTVLRLSALGAVEATRDAAPVDLGGPRQRAVLGLLIASGRRTVSTDRFVEDLWQGEPPPKALGALQVYVSHLRRALEPERQKRQPARVLRSIAPGYQLNLPDEQVDTWQFQSLVRQARAAQDPLEIVTHVDAALALWTDEPFAAYRDHDWASIEATRLWDVRADAVQLRAAAALDLGRAEEVVGTLETHVQAYPLREQGVRLLALALYRSQRQSDALRVLADARERLVDELGVDPSPELRELERDILNQADHLRIPALATPAISPTVSITPPAALPSADRLFGRSDELARLHSAAQTPGPTLVWVVGEAGIGKTTLVDRFCDEVVATHTVARGRCPEVDGAPPAWAWSGVLGDLRGHPVEPAELKDVTAFDLAHLVATAVDDASHDVLLVLDDLHRADGETLQVLRHVLTSTHRPLLVVGTLRGDEVSTDLTMAFAATAEHTVDRIELGGLPDTTARAILADLIDADLAETVYQQLVARAAGNPLFLKQVARLATSEGADIERQLPTAVRDILTRRFERLPGATVDILSRAALLGRDIDLDLLVAMESARGSETEEAIVDAVDAGIVAGLVHSAGPGALRFAHALVRDALYDRLPPMRRQRLHAAALEILESEHPDQVVALAHHAAAALEPRIAARAARHLDRALDHLLFLGSHVEAARFGALALRAHEMAETPYSERLTTRRLLMHATAATGDLRAAQALRRETVELASRHGTIRDQRMALIWIAPTVWSTRELHLLDHDLIARLRTALSELDAEDSDDAWLRVALLATLSRETEGSEFSDLAEKAALEAVRHAEQLGDGWLLCVALNALYLVSYPPRALGRLRDVGGRLVEAARSAGLPAFEAIGHYALFGAAAGDGDLDAAGDHMREATQSGTAGQLPLLLVVAGIFEGLVHLVHGELDRSAETYRAVTSQLAASGDPNGLIMQLVLDFTVSHARGDTSSHLDRITDIDAITPDVHDYLICALLDAGQDEAAQARWRADMPVKHDYLWLFNAPLRLINAMRLDERPTVERLYRELAPWRGHFGGMVAGTATLGPIDLYLGMAGQYLGRDEAEHDLRAAATIADRYGAGHWAEQARSLLSS